MSDNEMLYCLIAFILGWLASRMMGNGFSVGGTIQDLENALTDPLTEGKKKNNLTNCMREKLPQTAQQYIIDETAEQCMRSCNATTQKDGECSVKGDCIFPNECNTDDRTDRTLKCNPINVSGHGATNWKKKLIGCCSEYCGKEV